MNSFRIKALDGFRAIAILGVLWAHIWMFFGNPSCNLSALNVAAILSFFGTGVDLFFVVSGFCMYLMFVSGERKNIDWTWYIHYLRKRWLRIAPAFYVAIIVYGLAAVQLNFLEFDWLYALKNAFFVKIFFSDKTEYAPHFWSLCTEWHFYFLLPFILMAINRFSFLRTVGFIFFICIVFRSFFSLNLHDEFNIINYSISNRLVEFLMGIIAARIYLGQSREWIFRSYWGLVIGMLVLSAGRVLLSSSFQLATGWLGIFSRIFNLPILTAGYALVIVNCLLHPSIFSRFLESSLMTRIGKISYSMYLWHWVVAVFCSLLFKKTFQMDPFLSTNIVFFISLLVLYPLSVLSFTLLESPYFRKRYA